MDVSTYLEVLSLLENKELNEEQLTIALLSLYLDLPEEDIENLDITEINSYKQELISFINSVPPAPKPKLKLVDTDFYLINDLNKLSCGEFIDLNELITNGGIKNLLTILAILYRQKNKVNDPFFPGDYEPYGNYIYHRADLFNDTCIVDVFGVINKFIEWRTLTFTTYAHLFNDPEDDIDDEEDIDDPNESHINKAKRIKQMEIDKAKSQWSWQMFLLRLAKGDPLKMEAAAGMNFIHALNIMTMCKQTGLEL